MNFAESIAARHTMLAEGSVYERLRRNPDIVFDPAMRHGVLVYDPKGRDVLADIHRGYVAAAREAKLPLVLLSSTWRANAENIAASRFAGRPVNQDNIAALKAVAAESGHEIYVSGQMGCRGDAYKPDEALDAETAYVFHRPQAMAMAEAEPDFLFAATLPALSEARGIARALGETGLPYLISFVLRPNGRLLDGTPWTEAIKRLDDATNPPLGHAVNCVHPSVLKSALAILQERDATLCNRVVLFQANTANLSPEALLEATDLVTEEPETLAAQIAELHRRYGIPIVGGCCGTDERHIAALGLALRQ